MKQRIQGAIFGCVLTVLLLGTATAFGNDGIRNISVTFRNIRLVVNGQPITPRDGAGNIVEPFIFDGTTFLPVRAVGEVFGQEVYWDGSTSTVYVGPRGGGAVVVAGYTWLDHMQHLNHQASHGRWTTMRTWAPGSTSTDGTSFDRGLVFDNQWGGISAPKWQSIDVPLNANYNIFRGTLASAGGLARGNTQVRIYGDGRLLYTSPMISNEIIPVPFSIDVTNVLLMHIRVDSNNEGQVLGIVNARVERN
ncbi:MAG: stalk domain-containing protein [Defluviitaleaceae bacterium]|nr:stalk domain-containing protein [Defluviitaleaceae bacterium]